MAADARSIVADRLGQFALEIAGTDRDPLCGLVAIAADKTMQPMVRVYAMKSVLPYLHAAVPMAVNVSHTHLHDLANTAAAALQSYLEGYPPAPVIEHETSGDD